MLKNEIPWEKSEDGNWFNPKDASKTKKGLNYYPICYIVSI